MGGSRLRGALVVGAVFLACGGDGASSGDGATPMSSGGPGGADGGSSSGATPGTPGSGGGGSAAALATKLRGKPQLLIGMGNDLADNHDQDGAYTLGSTLDLHYVYLVGLQGQGGWPDWNANGSFVDMMNDAADRHGTTPMFTLYAMAAWGENNLSSLTNDGFMKPYLDGAKLLFTRVAAYKKPVVVHVEPDFWGFAQSATPQADAPAHVSANASECAGLGDTIAGFARCILQLGRTIAPNAVIGFHASHWIDDAPGTVAYMKLLGADKADFIGTDLLDRDAGCYELHTDQACQRGGKTGWYLDESNATSPNFHEAFAWAKAIHDGLSLPIMWWQIPFGVPSNTPGGSTGHYRDNKVHYIFAHPNELVAAGGFAAAFGVGADRQTYIDSDGDQFKNAVTGYYKAPTPIP